jgi:hypothetical protein
MLFSIFLFYFATRTPQHPHPMHRSHTDKTILLLKIEDKYVPIAEQAVHIMSQVAQQ